MLRYTSLACLLLLCQQAGSVQVTVDRAQRQILVDGQRFFARGVCYTPIPVGESYGDWLGESTQSIWLRDLDLIQEMDLNLLRVYTFDSTENHLPFLDACHERGLLVAVTLDYPEGMDYSDSTSRDKWKNRALAVVEKYKHHPAILLWGFGNEKNYYADTEQKRSEHLSYVNEVTEAIHQAESTASVWHPVCSPLMDNYLSEYFALEAIYPTAVDIWCLNLYRGTSFGSSLFSTYPSTLPMMITEYGADAYDNTNQREWQNDEQTNALVSLTQELRNWRDVVAGGIIFAFQDEWWKCDAPSVHDSCGAAFGGLSDGYANEEWWGVYATEAGTNPQARVARGAVAPLAALFAADTFQGSSSISAEADLYATKYDPGHNVGAVDEIVTKYHSWTEGSGPDGHSIYNEVGLLRFPTSDLSQCNDAEATVLLTLKWISTDSVVLAYGPVSDNSWSELTTTWSSFPSYDPLNRRTLTVTSAETNQQVSLTVTDWWSVNSPLSIWIQPDDTVAANSDENVNFFSREASEWARPDLTVSCSYSWSGDNWYIATSTTTATSATSTLTTSKTLTTATSSTVSTTRTITTMTSTMITSTLNTVIASTTKSVTTTMDANMDPGTTMTITSTSTSRTITSSTASDSVATTEDAATTATTIASDDTTSTTATTTTTPTTTTTTSTTTTTRNTSDDNTTTTSTVTVPIDDASTTKANLTNASEDAGAASTSITSTSLGSNVSTTSKNESSDDITSTTSRISTSSFQNSSDHSETLLESTSLSTTEMTPAVGTGRFDDVTVTSSLTTSLTLQSTTGKFGTDGTTITLASTLSTSSSFGNALDAATSTLSETTSALEVMIKASCRLQLQIDRQTDDLVPLVTEALALAFQVDSSRLRNVVVEMLRRLAVEAPVSTSSTVRVSYEVVTSTTRVTEVLSKVTTLSDPTSDVSERFSESLQQEGLNVTSIQMLEVPRVQSSEGSDASNQDPTVLLEASQIIIWILSGIAIAALAGCTACSAGYLCGYLYARGSGKAATPQDSWESERSEFPFCVVAAESTGRPFSPSSPKEVSFDAPVEHSGMSPVNATLSRKSRESPGGILRASAHQQSGKSVIREVLL